MASGGEHKPDSLGTSPSNLGTSPYSDESYGDMSPGELSDVTPQAAGPDVGFVPLEEESGPETRDPPSVMYGYSSESGLTSPTDSETCALIPNRPDNLLLSRAVRRRGSSTSCSSYNSDNVLDLESVLQVVSETPLHGTMADHDGQISFVAHDLEEMIRMSSPASGRSLCSTSSMTSSFCGSSFSGMSRSSSMPLQPSPDEAPVIDPHAVKDLETHARRVADNLDLLMGNLNINLHKMTRLSKSCLSVYGDGIERTCDSVDGSIKAMYALMAKCEEISRSMTPIYAIAEQIKEIKRLLDLFESQVAKDAKLDKEKR